MPTFIADIVIDGKDATGARILEVYARRPPDYAVYRTADRVLVQVTDHVQAEPAQRSLLARFNPLRGDINGLIDGWRKSKHCSLKQKADRYDRRVADGLIAGLEQDPEGAMRLLQDTKESVIDERIARARFEYLLAASVTSVVLIALTSFVNSSWFAGTIYTFPPPSGSLWLGAAAGTVGAFLSIAIAIRTRTILTDLHSLTNTADAVLRIVIGSIAAAMFVALLLSKAVVFAIGGLQFNGEPKVWVTIAIAAFVAGFSERLIPDLLSKTAATVTPPDKPVPPSKESAPADSKSTQQPSKPGEASTADPTDGENDIDNCLSGVEAQDNEATADSELPAATGGVSG